MHRRFGITVLGSERALRPMCACCLIVGGCTTDLHFTRLADSEGSGGTASAASGGTVPEGSGGADGAGGVEVATGGSTADCAGAAVCEGFEEGQDAFAIELMMGTAELSQLRARSGTTSLHATTPGDGAWGQATFAFAPIPEGKAYFRAHYFIPSGTVTGLINLFTLGQPNADSEIDIDVLGSGALEVFYHSDNLRYESAAGVVPEDRWFCIRGEIDVSATAGQVAVWLDDAPTLTTPTNHNTFATPGYSEIWVGIHWTEDGQGPAEVFVDDVAVSTSPLGC